jgi:hypothetical protein
MRLPINIKDIISKLKLKLVSPHFIIHYGLRNPRDGRGLGADGVSDEALVQTYCDALETLYKAMTSEPWRRDPPVVGPDGKTHVYVFNVGDPLTACDTGEEPGPPYIFLPSRSSEPTTEAERRRAWSEAVHEATHLFNFSQRPFYDKMSAALWAWFDEGFAIFMEMLVAPDNPDCFRFLAGWIDYPETPLDHPYGKYRAGMFVHYLAEKLGPEFVNAVWIKSLPEEMPLEALERLMPDGQRFLSADPAVRDIFASGYCQEPYFCGHCGEGFVPELFARYGGRAVTESLSLPASNGRQIADKLDHLACRYYRLYIDGGTTLRVSVAVDDPCEETPLKVEVAVVTRDRQRAHVETLCPAEPAEGESWCLSCVVSTLDPDAVDHVVLIVSNCGTRVAPNGDGDDGKQFRIKAWAD